MTRDREDTKDIIGEVLEKASLMLAPFAPYISEYVYNNFSKDSVHLSNWPKADEKKIDENLEGNFKIATEIIEDGLALRDYAKIGLKWPLAKAKIFSNKIIGFDGIIQNQLNVKKIEWCPKVTSHYVIELDTKLTPELEQEGYAREMSRQVQAFRKKLGLTKGDEIELSIFADNEFKEILEKQKEFIKERTNSKMIKILENVTTNKERFKNNIEFKIKDKKGKIVIHTKV
jgi:valyl-tRNA synthetase